MPADYFRGQNFYYKVKGALVAAPPRIYRCPVHYEMKFLIVVTSLEMSPKTLVTTFRRKVHYAFPDISVGSVISVVKP